MLSFITYYSLKNIEMVYIVNHYIDYIALYCHSLTKFLILQNVIYALCKLQRC